MVTLHRLLGWALAASVASGVDAPAQERAAKSRPVPGLSSPSPLPWPLPAARDAQCSAGFVIDTSGKQARLRWVRDELRAADLGSFDADGFGASSRALAIGDFLGEGRQHLLTRGTTSMHLLHPDGAVERELPALFALQRGSTWLSGSAFDWFGDGRACPAFVANGTLLAVRDCLGTPRFEVLLRFAPLDLPAGDTAAASAGDFDLDGLPDLLVALPWRGLVWYRNEGTRREPRFSAAIPLWPSTPGTQVTWVMLAPVDDDPWLDVLVGTAVPTVDTVADFTARLARQRTPEEQQELARLETMISGQALQTQFGNAVAGAGPDVFQHLLAKREWEKRRDQLKWREQPMTATPPVVHLRAQRR